jgi:hypothetical protein
MPAAPERADRFSRKGGILLERYLELSLKRF